MANKIRRVEDQLFSSLNEFSVEEQEMEKDLKVVVLKLDLADHKTRIEACNFALPKVSKIPGVTSVAMDKGDKMTVIGTMDPQDVLRKLNKYWRTEIVMVDPWEKVELEKSRSKQMDKDEELALLATKSLNDKTRSKLTKGSGDSGSGTSSRYVARRKSETWTVESTILEDAFCWRKYGTKEILNSKFPRSYFRCIHKYTQGCQATKYVQQLELEPRMFSITYLGNHTCNTNESTPKSKPCDHHFDEIIMDSEEQKSSCLTTSVKDEEENHHDSSNVNDLSLVWKDIDFAEDLHHHQEAIYGCGETIPHNMRNPSYRNDEWYSLCEFLSNRLRPLTLSGCRAEDVIDFLGMWQASGDVEALAGRLSAACDVFGIKPKENPFRTAAVTAYLKTAKEMTRETECILVFSCNENDDVEETHFIQDILKELEKQEVTSLTYNLSRGESLDSEMLNRSSVGIMVLSNSFPRSSQCLDHLVAIMEHRKSTDLTIIPTYFKVKSADICEEVYLLYLNSTQADRVQKWKAAMTEMASIDGHQWTEGIQFMFAKEVVRDACLRLYLKNSKNLVRILALLDHSQPLDADIVGIWGMAGIGKTSIAREIFRTLAPQYDLCYFLQDFHLICQMKGLRQMRDDFFTKVFGEESLSISACDIKPSFMRDWFQNKTILLVLDDVSNARDVEAVVGGFSWFSHGHKIILTSRQKQVLVQCKVKEPHEIQKLCKIESFRLCKQYLNGESGVMFELMSCCSGIPLALKVLGSSVSKQHINNMKQHLQSLRKNPPTQIQEAFRRSFDGLDENEMNIFLDLACFFRGENKDHVVQLLDACGFLTYLGICDLVDESLISVVDNRIEIPIPFQDMGRFIVWEEEEDPCGRSRLWDSSDIADVLTTNSGTEAIEGIFLDASDLTCELSPTVFSMMYRLRLLKFYCSTFGTECKLSLPQGLDTLPDELRLLHWENYPLRYLPLKFNPENLVEINMPYSKMEKLWEGKKNLEKLKKIKLSHSRNLTDILMLSEAWNLEHIDLEACTSLVDVSTSIPRCGKLVSLNMKDCSHLQSLPAMVDLSSLKLLNLSGCLELEEIQDFAPNLKELHLAGTAIREFPSSIENLTKLVTLDLENCRRLQQLPFGIRNLKSIIELKLSGCTSLESLPKLEALDCGTS